MALVLFRVDGHKGPGVTVPAGVDLNADNMAVLRRAATGEITQRAMMEQLGFVRNSNDNGRGVQWVQAAPPASRT